MFKGLTRVAFLTPALAMQMPLSAQAADAAFCQQYAAAAVNQAQVALARPTCAPGAHGPRWATDQQTHYNWCLAQSPTAIARERDLRTSYIRRCRGF